MKWGLGQSYDNVSLLSPKARGYLDITKPASTVGAMGAALMASLFYFYYTGNPHLIADNFSTIVFVVITMGLAHGASQAMNMAEDAEMDRKTEHKSNRPIPSGVVSEEEARTLSWFFIIFAVSRAYMVNNVFGYGVTLLVILGVFYNLDPIRAKERIISIPWQAVSRGFIPYPVIWAAYGDISNPVPWALGVFMFFYVFGFQNTADIIDEESDRAHGVSTFVVEFGMKKVSMIASGSTLMMIATFITSVELGIWPERMATMMLIIPFCITMIYYITIYPESVSENTGNHPSWIWFYVGLVLCIAIPLVTEIMSA